jgi:hypothetical protein
VAFTGGHIRRIPGGLHWPERDLWTAEHKASRQVAAKLCRACPVIRQRGRAADTADELWHVWGGVDRAAWTRDLYRRRAS